jgi:hypothetical protein
MPKAFALSAFLFIFAANNWYAGVSPAGCRK